MATFVHAEVDTNMMAKSNNSPATAFDGDQNLGTGRCKGNIALQVRSVFVGKPNKHDDKESKAFHGDQNLDISSSNENISGSHSKSNHGGSKQHWQCL